MVSFLLSYPSGSFVKLFFHSDFSLFSHNPLHPSLCQLIHMKSANMFISLGSTKRSANSLCMRLVNKASPSPSLSFQFPYRPRCKCQPKRKTNSLGCFIRTQFSHSIQYFNITPWSDWPIFAHHIRHHYQYFLYKVTWNLVFHKTTDSSLDNLIR